MAISKYCSIEHVLSVAVDFRDDVEPLTGSDSLDGAAQYRPNTNVISREAIEGIIEEATDLTKARLQPRYSLELIESYDPLPPVVIALCKTLAARLMYERYAAQSIERNQERIRTLAEPIGDYQSIIDGGVLLDYDNNVIVSENPTEYYPGSDNDLFRGYEKLKELYEDADPESRLY